MKRILMLLLCIALLLSMQTLVFADPQVSAESAILIDADDSSVLYEKDADDRLAMASTTKIMTALIVIERADLSEVITIPKEACGIEGSSAYLYEGEKMSVRDLLFALMLQSANDAACALALHVAESFEAFSGLMNEKATSIGMQDSAFVNPHGLPSDGHYSTARDMARLMQAAMQVQEFAAISGAKNHTTTEYPGGAKHYFRNHNKLLNDYEYCTAGKTGFTKAAGRCLVSSAEKDGAKLICVTLSAPDDWNDHKALYEHGFSLFSSHILYQTGELRYDLPVVGSVDNFASVENLSTISASLRTKDGIRVLYDLPHFAYAPIQGIDSLDAAAPSPPDAMCAGYAIIMQGEREICRVKLFYKNSIAEYIPPTIWERILQFFGWKKSESKNS